MSSIPETLVYPASGIDRRKRGLLGLMVLGSVAVAVPAVGMGWWTGNYVAFAVSAGVMLAVVWGCVLPAAWRVVVTSHTRSCLLLEPGGVYIQRGPSRSGVGWADVRRLRIHHDPSGGVFQVQVYTAEGLALEVTEFERLAEAAEVMRAVVPADAEVTSE